MYTNKHLNIKFFLNTATLLNQNVDLNVFVENVKIIEVPNHLYKLEKSSFVLINNYIFERNGISILDALEILDKKNISALGIICNQSPVDNIDTDLDKFNTLKKDFDFPILVFSRGICYKDIIKYLIPQVDINEYLFNQMSTNLNALKNSESYTMDNILNLLFAYVNKPIILFSEDLQILNYLKPESDSTKRMIPIDKIYNLITSNINNKYSFSSHTIFHEEEYYILYPLKIPQKNLGFLCIVLNKEIESDEISDKISNSVVPHIIINMLTYRKGEVVYEKSKEEFVRGILYGLFPDKNFIKAQSEKFQFKYDQKLFVWLLQINPLDNKNNDFSLYSNMPNKTINKVMSIAKSRYPEDYSLIDNKGIIFIQAKDSTPDSIQIKNFNSLIKQLELYLPEYVFSIGISRAYEPIDQLKYAYEDVVFSIKIGSNIFKGSKKVYPYNDLILYHLIYSLKDNPIIERVYNITLKKIIEYDEKNNTDLFETLTVLIDNNFNMTEASDKLFVHRNTLYKRIERIEEATGYDLDNSQSRLLLHLGLKIHDIYTLTK